MMKRHADWLEKMSVAGIVGGILQESPYGVIIGLISYGACLFLTKKTGG
ncbi:MAG: hypothetical protein LBD42_08660 [Desulfovibrio sp.]|jgi:hypothetical protein|nr:hypothetical protein [Desulfovibrio sp.]